MRGTLGHASRVAVAHMRIAVANELQYRSNMWAYLVATLIDVGVSLLSLAIVYAHVDRLGGWTSPDLLVLLGVFFLIGAVIRGLVHPSVSNLSTEIRTGNFDFRLLRPVDTQLIAAVHAPDPWQVVRAAAGVAILVTGVMRGGLDAGRSAGEVTAVALGMFACACLLTMAFWMLVASVTFWTIQGTGMLFALGDMYDAMRYPVSMFPFELRVLLSSVFPLGLAVTAPAAAVTGHLDRMTAAACVGVALFVTAAARMVWIVAVRRYEGASG